MSGPGCNLSCVFCEERSAPVVSSPQKGIVKFSGSEPFLEPDFFEKFSGALKNGGSVILETNGLYFAYPKSFQLLPPPDHYELKILLPSPDADQFDTITQRPGSFSIWTKAIQNLQQKNWPFSLNIPFSAWTEKDDALLPGFLSKFNIVPRKLFVQIRKGVPQELVTRLQKLSKTIEVPIRFSPGHPLPPCLFSSPEMAQNFYEDRAFSSNQPSQGEVKANTCLDCILDHGCTGLAPGLKEYLALLKPLKKKQLQNSWSLQETFNRERNENILTWDFADSPAGPKAMHALFRVTFQCNHHCEFCWVNPHLEKPTQAEIDAALTAAQKAGVRAITLTGGEPTLVPNLGDIIQTAKSFGLEVYLQTHAMRLKNMDFANSLQQAGLDFAFVSLHGHNATLSDAITGYPSGFQQTVDGIKNLISLGIPVGISHVLGPKNAPFLIDFGKFVAAEFPAATLMLSTAHQVNDALTYRAITAPFSLLKRPLMDLYRQANSLGLKLAGLSGQCGIPPCVLDGDDSAFEDLAPVPPTQNPDFHKPDFCSDCRFTGVCWGPRTRYLATHGTDGLSPISGPPAIPKFGENGLWKNASDLSTL